VETLRRERACHPPARSQQEELRQPPAAELHGDVDGCLVHRRRQVEVRDRRLEPHRHLRMSRRRALRERRRHVSRRVEHRRLRRTRDERGDGSSSVLMYDNDRPVSSWSDVNVPHS
jgi:hypothetical protein